MADHNDPNAVNSIFSDIDESAADLYDMFGWPGDDTAGGGKVVVALTFASSPDTGVFDQDMLYRIHLAPATRLARLADDHSLDGLLTFLEALREKYLAAWRASEIRVVFEQANRARVDFIGFRGGSFSFSVEANRSQTIDVENGHAVKVFLGGRDDAFFNDLTGFFRSINYAPQFYNVPHSTTDLRELPIPKTLLELEGNDLFNFDPANPDLGYTKKDVLPSGPYTWDGDRFKKDADGNFRFVYTGEDARAGNNVNALVFELPMAFLRSEPDDRVVNVWGESWVRKAADKVETIPDNPFWLEHPFARFEHGGLDDELKRYKLVDTVGQPFADAALNEREDNRQLGANNFLLAPHFLRRLAHLGWGFGPSITALGLKSSFDHDDSPVPVHRTYALAPVAFPRVKKVLLQELNMPDDSWNPKSLDIPLRRPIGIFVPNVCAIDLDTTGTWPFGRRLEDQVATRFLSLFLDMDADFNGRRYHIELLSDQALWDAAPIVPKCPPNPVANDKEFLSEFPYLAEPW